MTSENRPFRKWGNDLIHQCDMREIVSIACYLAILISTVVPSLAEEDQDCIELAPSDTAHEQLLAKAQMSCPEAKYQIYACKNRGLLTKGWLGKFTRICEKLSFLPSGLSAFSETIYIFPKGKKVIFVKSHERRVDVINSILKAEGIIPVPSQVKALTGIFRVLLHTGKTKTFRGKNYLDDFDLLMIRPSSRTHGWKELPAEGLEPIFVREGNKDYLRFYVLTIVHLGGNVDKTEVYFGKDGYVESIKHEIIASTGLAPEKQNKIYGLNK